MNTDIQLRKFSPAHLNRILEIEKSSFPLDAYSKKRFENFYKKGVGDFIVAKTKNRLVGYIMASQKNSLVDLQSVAVDKNYRNFGIGKILVEFILHRFEKRGFERASLKVRTNNKAAISFYKKLGFKITKTLRNYYCGGSNAYQMEKAFKKSL